MTTSRPNRASAGSAGRGARGFSMVEMLVVVILLGVLVGVAAPRLAVIAGRGTEATAVRAGALLSDAARRDALTSQRLAVEFDAARGTLALLTIDPEDGVWREDPLAPRVEIGGATLREATADGVTLDGTNWRLELPRNTPRPAIRLVFTNSRGADAWTVDLASRASRATVRAGTAVGAGEGESVDLDEVARGEQPW
ncbi:MAG: prepilin-type N-terminal cleavage/methylation domain-containing protein [Planctomycetota bacterium]|nr:prepilin-type N-terminal cleavage/methylation domain-containing protein [Planctomycetota bacterium]